MSDTNLLSNLKNVHKGPCLLGFQDEVNNLLVLVGKVDGLTLTRETDNEMLTEIINGQEVESDGASVAERWRLAGTFVETLDPNTQYFFLKNCGNPAIDPYCRIGTITQRMKVFHGRQRILAHNNGFYGTGTLPMPSDIDGTNHNLLPAIDGFTTPEAGVYTFYVIAIYGTSTSNSFTSAPVTAAQHDCIMLQISPPAGGAVPDAYAIYAIKSPGGIGAATLWLVTTSTTVWFQHPVVGGALLPADGTTSFIVTSVDGMTTYDPGVHYTIDSSCAMLCTIAPAVPKDPDYIQNGQDVLVTYSYWVNPKSSMSLGPAKRNPKYVHAVLIALRDDDRASPVGRGVEIHLYKIMANSGFDWSLSQNDFKTGFNFTWPVMMSENYLHHGDVYTYNRMFEGYDLLEWANLTMFTNQENCELVEDS